MLINIYITVVPGGLNQIQVPNVWHILQTYWGSGPLLCYLVHKNIWRHIPLPVKNLFLWLFITCIFMVPVKKLGKLLKNKTTKKNMKKIGNAKQDWVHWELQELQFLISFFTEPLMCRSHRDPYWMQGRDRLLGHLATSEYTSVPKCSWLSLLWP